MHVTLAYLGTQDDVPVDMDGLAELVAQWAADQQPLSGEVSGPATFEGTDNADNPVQVALADVPGLPEARQSLLDHLAGSGIEQQSEHSFTPPTPPSRYPRTASAAHHSSSIRSGCGTARTSRTFP
jgi:2'-5' RNA ligase